MDDIAPLLLGEDSFFPEAARVPRTPNRPRLRNRITMTKPEALISSPMSTRLSRSIDENVINVRHHRLFMKSHGGASN